MLSLQYNIHSDKALNGQEALDKVKAKASKCEDNYALDCNLHDTYKLILMDCNMPVMDGITATREIRKYETDMRNQSTCCPPSYIAALTAYTSGKYKQEFLEAGANSFISKPITNEQIIKVLQ